MKYMSREYQLPYLDIKDKIYLPDNSGIVFILNSNSNERIEILMAGNEESIDDFIQNSGGNWSVARDCNDVIYVIVKRRREFWTSRQKQN